MNHPFPRCQVLPLPDFQASFQIEGQERLRWHFGKEYPRPFFYPLLGPSGTSLTRMGHPGDAGHDHHRSVWFAHNDVQGANFWSDKTNTRIVQSRWLIYHDADDEAAMGVLLLWRDDHNAVLMEQELVAVVRPHPAVAEETLLEFKSTFRPNGKELVLGQTNFGFLAVRVAKHVSAHFGAGTITNSEGQVDEENLFGKPARWMDYSGPKRSGGKEGITYFDHPGNPHTPSKWHVREDGWMGASLCRDEGLTITKDEPLVLRYLLHVHDGAYDQERAKQLAEWFADSLTPTVEKKRIRHQGHVYYRS